MKKYLIIIISIIFASKAMSQNVGIGTNNPDASAKLEIQAINGGILIPRIDIQSATDVTTIPSPATGLMIWNTAATFGTPGFYFNAGTTVTANWLKVLDSSSSLNDADADITNELQDLSISGTTLSLTNDATTVDLTNFNGDIRSVTAGDGLVGGGTSGDVTVDVVATNGLTVAANDIKLGGTLTQNTTITQGAYTMDFTSTTTDGFSVDGTTFSVDAANNRVGIGTAAPTERLSVFPNTDNSADIGRAHIGAVGHTDYAAFSHVDMNSTVGYALLQSNVGITYLNAATGQNIQFRNNNTDQFEMEADGDLKMLGDNSIKMPNNIRWVADRAATTFSVSSSWRALTYTETMNVESGNVIKLDANSLLRLTGGSGDDDFYIRVFIDGTGGCADSYSDELGWIRHSEGGGDHDNFTTYSYMDVVSVTCDGTMRFRLEIKNTGDDAWQYSDAILTAIKF